MDDNWFEEMSHKKYILPERMCSLNVSPDISSIIIKTDYKTNNKNNIDLRKSLMVPKLIIGPWLNCDMSKLSTHKYLEKFQIDPKKNQKTNKQFIIYI